jgi:hypothetical protein
MISAANLDKINITFREPNLIVIQVSYTGVLAHAFGVGGSLADVVNRPDYFRDLVNEAVHNLNILLKLRKTF